jgi:hypothetical protein
MVKAVRLFLCLAMAMTAYGWDGPPKIKVAIVGLVHGHVKGFLGALPRNESAELVAIVEPQTALAQ